MSIAIRPQRAARPPDRATESARSLTRVNPADAEEDRERPLDLRLIRRVLQFTRPHAAKRNWLFLFVIVRAVQLPALTWTLAAIIDGPIQRGDLRGLALGSAGFALLVIATQLVMHFRQRFALELGEAVVSDLRNQLFAHLQTMPMSWFHRTKVGRIISRMTSDVEDVRSGVQEVLFVSLVQFGQMLVAAACMLWYERRLFLIVLGLAPVLWMINQHFHRRLSATMRDAPLVQSRRGHARGIDDGDSRHPKFRAPGRECLLVSGTGE